MVARKWNHLFLRKGKHVIALNVVRVLWLPIWRVNSFLTSYFGVLVKVCLLAGARYGTAHAEAAT